MLAILGKTASGKTTLVNELVNNFGFKQIVTYTTRPIREGEIPDITYHYISAEEFEKKKLEGFFAEATSYCPAQGGIWSYGTALKDIEEADDNTVVIINPKGLRSLSEKGYSKNITSLYLMARDDVLIDRLKDRGDSPAEANRRLEADKADFHLLEKEVDLCFRNEPYWTIPEIAKVIANFLYVRNAFRGGAVDCKGMRDGKPLRPTELLEITYL